MKRTLAIGLLLTLVAIPSQGKDTEKKEASSDSTVAVATMETSEKDIVMAVSIPKENVPGQAMWLNVRLTNKGKETKWYSPTGGVYKDYVFSAETDAGKSVSLTKFGAENLPPRRTRRRWLILRSALRLSQRQNN